MSIIFLLLSQTKLLTQYVLNLAKYDQNYDIRDRARFIRQLIVPTEKSGALSKYAKKLFLALKPAPVLESPFKGEKSSLDHSLEAVLGITINTETEIVIFYFQFSEHFNVYTGKRSTFAIKKIQNCI